MKFMKLNCKKIKSNIECNHPNKPGKNQKI